MKTKLSNSNLRIIAGVVMALIAGGAAGLQYFGFPGVRWLGCAVAILMIA
ncbi:MAG: hypothetical protein K2L94_04070 [Alphaproteobacteria bacterium]|nr:hypothetical protein [Alphaproteobacteria bacterium]